VNYPCVVHHIYTSPSHNYFTREKFDIGTAPDIEHQKIILEAGLGLPEDRFAHSPYPITFFSSEIAEEIFDHHKKELDYKLLRRNIIISGINIQELIGVTFSIGEVVFEGMKHCNPCPWMNAAIGKGTYKMMKGRGGLRASVKRGGVLQVGSTYLETSKQLLKNPLEALAINKLPF